VKLIDSVTKGSHLVQAARSICFRVGFHLGRRLGLWKHIQEDRSSEQKQVFMYSRFQKDQKSADASISGSRAGAMSWVFWQTIEAVRISRILRFGIAMSAEGMMLVFCQILQNTRELLKETCSNLGPMYMRFDGGRLPVRKSSKQRFKRQRSVYELIYRVDSSS
jgi:hypothetical protein